MNDLFKKILLKKAKGYSSKETVEEYSLQDNSLILSKRKVTTKKIPPDVSALKVLLELENTDSIDQMTDEQLVREKKRLLQLLNEFENNNKESKNNDD